MVKVICLLSLIQSQTDVIRLVSFDGVASAIESSDLVLDIGPVHSDSNTGGFTRNITDDHTIILAHDYCQIRGKRYEGIHFLPVLKRIVEELEKQPAKYEFHKKQTWTKLEVRFSPQ